MSAVHVLRPLRRGVAPLAVCLCLTAVPAAAWRDTGLPQPSAAAQHGGRGDIVLAQAGGAPISPYQEPAPDLFEATGTALWDGKRTLQGVWVAHPLATSARRVRIYNAETGAAVDGALFKRDPALTGPSVLVSSEAAQFLGMTPGDEVGLRIVALTPSQKPETQPAPDGQAAATPSADAPESPSATPPAASGVTPPAEPTAAAQARDAAVIEPIESATAPAEPATGMVIPAPRPDRATATAAAEPVAADSMAVPAGKTPQSGPQPAAEATGPSAQAPARALASPASPRETAAVRPLFQSAPPRDPAGDSSVEPAATVASVTIAEPTPDPSAPSPSQPVFQPAPPRPASDALAIAPSLLPAAGPPDRPTDDPADNPASGQFSTSPATPRVPPGPPISEPAARPGAVEAAPAPVLPTRAAAAGTLSQPYVQAGIFGVAENADRLLGRLKAANLPALGKPIQLNGKPMIRVLAGPFAVAAERDAAVRTIRGMGLRDAAPVAR